MSSNETHQHNAQPALTEFESLLVGAIGGTLETSIQMPLITWKICVQEGRSYPKHIREWYRGVFINASSLSPITAVQCYANTIFQNLIRFNDRHRALNDSEQMVCSAAAGSVSALIYCPVDLLVIQQQKMKASLSHALNQIRKQYGTLRVYRGFFATIGRESIYTMGYLGIAPTVNQHLSKSTFQNSYFKHHPVTCYLVASMCGGTIAALVTHPIDTAKTCVQSDLVKDKYPTALYTIKHLYKKGGISVLFKGVIPRTLRLCGACFVISQVREAMIRFKS